MKPPLCTAKSTNYKEIAACQITLQLGNLDQKQSPERIT